MTEHTETRAADATPREFIVIQLDKPRQARLTFREFRWLELELPELLRSLGHAPRPELCDAYLLFRTLLSAQLTTGEWVPMHQALGKDVIDSAMRSPFALNALLWAALRAFEPSLTFAATEELIVRYGHRPDRTLYQLAQEIWEASNVGGLPPADDARPTTAEGPALH